MKTLLFLILLATGGCSTMGTMMQGLGQGMQASAQQPVYHGDYEVPRYTQPICHIEHIGTFETVNCY